MDKSSTQYELSKLFKPITDPQKKLKESIVSEIKPNREGIKNALTFPQFSSIMAQEDSDDDDDDQGTIHMGDIAENTWDNLLQHQALIKPLDCTIKMASFSLERKRLKYKKTILLLMVGITNVHLVYES